MKEKIQKLFDANKVWLNVTEAADYLSVSRPTIYRWHKQGLINMYKVGDVVRIKKEDMDNLLEKSLVVLDDPSVIAEEE